MAQLAAVTVDLDGLGEYHRIHGLPAPSGPDVVLEKALPRFLEACDRLRVRATLFVIGRTLEDPRVATLLRQAHAAGHELASHSHAHDYRLSQFTVPAMRADLQQARDALTSLVGVPPVGFRAPGYNLSPELVAAVAQTGHAYDSSVFPSLAYFAARAGVLAQYAATGAPSSSLLGDWRQFAGPRTPYRPSAADHLREGSPALGLWELPMAVAGPLGLPMIGTFVPLYPAPVRGLLRGARTRLGGPFNLELHAIDFSDPADGFEPALLERQLGLASALQSRMAPLEDLVRGMARRMNVQPLRDWLPVLDAAA